MGDNPKALQSLHHHSFVICKPSSSDKINNLDFDHKWDLSTIEDPSLRHWISPNEESRSTHSGDKERLKKSARRKRERTDNILCKEIIIDTEDRNIANNIQSLIKTGCLLAYPDPDSLPETESVHPHNEDTFEEDREIIFLEKQFNKKFEYEENAYFGCLVAKNAWHDISSIYALEKYKFSKKLDSITPHSAHPHAGKIFECRPADFSYHVSAANAFFVAYSLIEDLKFDIRSSPQNPRFEDSDEYIWNEEVKNDVVDRLKSSGIDPDDTIQWVYRGDERELLEEAELDIGQESEYANDRDILDKELKILEAIHITSLIRNKFLAHGFSETIKTISPYDVYNVQNLARRLILGRLSLWKPSDHV